MSHPVGPVIISEDLWQPFQQKYGYILPLAHICEGLKGLKMMINSALKRVNHQIMSNNELFHYNPVWVIKRLICQCWFWQVLQPGRAILITTVLVPHCTENSFLSHYILFILYRTKRDAVILFQDTPVMLWGMICHCYSVLTHLHLKHDPSGF